MYKFFSGVFLVATLFLFSVGNTKAALITVERNGNFQWNVLGAIAFTNIGASPIGSNTTEVVLTSDGERVILDYGTESYKSSVDVTEYSDEIIEIEKKTSPEKVIIIAEDGGFLIRQRGITATTKYPIKISKSEDNISVETETGVRYIAVLPYEAVLQTVRANIIGDISEDGRVEIVERSEGELAYKISGEKSFSVFKFFDVPVDIDAYVSVLTGNILEVDQPVWSRVLSFLLT